MSRGGRSRRNEPLPNVQIPQPGTLQFSFKHLVLGNGKFPVESCPLEFWPSLLQKLQEYSAMRVEDFIDQNHNERRHIVDFEETTEPNGFNLDTDQIGFLTPWQFAVGLEQQRVIGFLVDATFFVVWLDPNHALYKGQNGGAARAIKPLLSKN